MKFYQIKDYHNTKDTSVMYLNHEQPLPSSLLYHVTSVGYADFDTTHCVSLKKNELPYLHLTYIIKGGISGNINEFQFECKEGDILLIDGFSDIKYYGTVNGTHVAFLMFSGNNSMAFLKNWRQLFMVFKHSKYFEKHSKMLKNIAQEVHKTKEYSSMKFSQIIYSMLLELLNETAPKKTTYSEPVKTLLDKLHAEKFEKCTVDKLCDDVYFSKEYIYKQFKKEVGMSPYQYLLDLKLKASKELITNSNLTIKEISDKIGFSSYSNFVNHFRRVYKLTPNAIRKYLIIED